jgi:hypothetical protein
MLNRLRTWRDPMTKLERELRARRPEARDAFVENLARTIVNAHVPRARRWARAATALAVISAGLAAFGAYGGIGYAAHAVSDAYSTASSALTPSSQTNIQSNTPAHDQYGGGGGGGCTPGYWKQTQHFFRWGGISQSTSFNSVFGVSSPFPNSLTLLAALQQGGGGANALGRHAVAGYLNASTPGMNYAYTVSQVITMVHNALVSGNATTIENTKNSLEAAEREGPLC